MIYYTGIYLLSDISLKNSYKDIGIRDEELRVYIAYIYKDNVIKRHKIVAISILIKKCVIRADAAYRTLLF